VHAGGFVAQKRSIPVGVPWLVPHLRHAVPKPCPETSMSRNKWVHVFGKLGRMIGQREGAIVAETFDIEQQWPELFAQLDAKQRRAVVQSLASAWHEGWEPNREDVENLTDRARGAIDREEYMRRVRQAAERQRKVAAVSR